MTEQELIEDAQRLSRWQQHKFMVLVGLTIIISLFLVIVALRLYSSSGAAQLDLSRPGYQSVRKEASKPVEFTSFPSTGTLEQDDLETFRSLFDEQIREASGVDSYGGDVMSDAALDLVVQQPTQ